MPPPATACPPPAAGAGALFHSPHSHREAADESRLRFRSPGGDTLTALHVVSAYDAASGGGKARGEGRRWAEANFLNWRTLETAVQVRTRVGCML